MRKETIHITDTNQQLTTNFQSWEFYKAAHPPQEFECPLPLVMAAQILRDWLGFPVIVSSTYRPNDPYGKGSSHDKGVAIDFYTRAMIHGDYAPLSPSQVIEKYNQEVLNYLAGKGSKIIENLREAGIDGFGIEGGCIHMDCFGYGAGKRINHVDKYGNYSAFEWRQGGKINRSL